MEQKQPLTVKALTKYIKLKFDYDKNLQHLLLKGEISNFKRHSRGHFYFTLKDDEAQINAVMFASAASQVSFMPKEGMQVVVKGHIAVYEAGGSYSLYVKEMTEDGIGNLYVAFTQMKERLGAEGLFDARFKQPIPPFPHAIGVITSPTGAAIRDVLSTIKRRFPLVKVYVYPALVQGEQAAPSIVKCIQQANELKQVDTLIVGRGGGSIEDLWAFNEEIVARAIFESKIPIISAVGHETDFTIADFAADLRAPTPSAAAELAVDDFAQVMHILDNYRERFRRDMRERIEYQKVRLEQYKLRLKYLSPESRLRDNRQILADYDDALRSAMKNKLQQYRHRLGIYLERYQGMSPLVKLNQGYSFVADQDGRGISSVEQVTPGDRVEISVTDGVIRAEVFDSRREEWQK